MRRSLQGKKYIKTAIPPSNPKVGKEVICLYPPNVNFETPGMKNHSALVGFPPNSQDDYWIIRGMFRYLGIDDAINDPNNGYTVVPIISDSQKDEQAVASIIIGLVMSLLLMTVASCIRLGLRLFRPGLRWGWDDWMLIPAMVSFPKESNSTDDCKAICKYTSLITL